MPSARTNLTIGGLATENYRQWLAESVRYAVLTKLLLDDAIQDNTLVSDSIMPESFQ
jgi:hypothetical protein